MRYVTMLAERCCAYNIIFLDLHWKLLDGCWSALGCVKRDIVYREQEKYNVKEGDKPFDRISKGRSLGKRENDDGNSDGSRLWFFMIYYDSRYCYDGVKNPGSLDFVSFREVSPAGFEPTTFWFVVINGILIFQRVRRFMMGIRWE